MVEYAQNLFSTRRGSVLVGIGAAAIAAIVVFVYLHNYRNSLNSAAAPASVLVAKNLIQKGTSGNIIGQTQQFQVASLPKKELQLGALTDPAALNGRVAAADILEYLLKIPPGSQQTGHSMRLSTVMRKLGWERPINGNVTIGGKRVKGYFRTHEEPPAMRF